MKMPKTLVLLALVAIGLGCGYSKPSTTPSPGTSPAIAQLNPTAATAGGAQFMLEVDGSNFANNAVVNFNSTAMATSLSAAGKLQASIPAAAIANSGTVPVTVTNPGTGGLYGTPAVTSQSVNFTISQ
jgi:hypothetical protein